MSRLSTRILATELPTVPKPSRATLQTVLLALPLASRLGVESGLAVEGISSPLLQTMAWLVRSLLLTFRRRQVLPALFHYQRSSEVEPARPPIRTKRANEWGQ